MLLSILSVSCFRMYVGLNDWMANLFLRVCLLTAKDTHCLWSVQSMNIQKILCRWQGQKEDMLNVPLLNLSYCELSIRVKTFLLSLYLWLSSASHTAGRSKHICVCVCVLGPWGISFQWNAPLFFSSRSPRRCRATLWWNLWCFVFCEDSLGPSSTATQWEVTQPPLLDPIRVSTVLQMSLSHSRLHWFLLGGICQCSGSDGLVRKLVPLVSIRLLYNTCF